MSKIYAFLFQSFYITGIYKTQQVDNNEQLLNKKVKLRIVYITFSTAEWNQHFYQVI